MRVSKISDLILLIDDDHNLRRVTEYNLMAKGLDVVTAASGIQGLEQFEICSPDLVVTDVKLGDMNGLDLLEKIKAVDIRIIAATNLDLKKKNYSREL